MSNLPAGIVLGIASAVVYGISVVVQHRVVHNTRASGWAGLRQIVASPAWLMAVGGDFCGFVLQVGALSLAPVVIVQPLAVLMLPVALAAGYALGAPRPGWVDFAACALLAGSLSGFLWIVGGAQRGTVPQPVRILAVLVLVLALVLGLMFVTHSAPPIPRSAVLGGVAGVCWGTLAVFVNAASDSFEDGGVRALLTTPRGYLPLVAVAALGLLGMAFTMASFKAGSLAVVLPVNLCADPLSAIIFGALLLGQHIPLDAPSLLGYALCFCGLAAAATRIARPVVSALQAHSEEQAQSPS